MDGFVKLGQNDNDMNEFYKSMLIFRLRNLDYKTYDMFDCLFDPDVF